MAKRILFTDCIIHTGRAKNDVAHSMLVQSGRIIALDAADSKGAKKVSLAGRHIYPCLIDSHLHLLATVVLAAGGFDLCRIENEQVVPDALCGIEKSLRRFAESKPKSSIVVGNGYITTAIKEKRLPNKSELDDWCGGRAVVIYTIDGHASALSTAMLQKLGIDPLGHDGILVGEAHERIQGRLTDIIASSVNLKTLAKGVANFHNACAEYGIACVGALEGNGDSKKDPTTRLIISLARRFRIDVRFYLQYMELNKADKLKKFQSHPRIGGCGDWEMDGAVGAHTAAFSLPYLDNHSVAPPYYEQRTVTEKVLQADQNGYQIACHAIGDQAVERILCALEKTPCERLHRIEHCEFTTKAQLKRLSKLNCAVVMQPGYAWIDKRFLHTYRQHLTPEAINMLRLRSFLESGICVCGSSDAPVQELDPWLQMMGMVDFYRPEESISVYDAFCCYTKNPARALLEEGERGQLLPGCKADFFTADCNIFDLFANEVGAFRPLATYYGGKLAKKHNGSLWEFVCMMLRRPKKV